MARVSLSVVLLLFCAGQKNSKITEREQQDQGADKGRDFNIWRNDERDTILDYFLRSSLDVERNYPADDFTVLPNDFTVMLSLTKHLLPISPVAWGDPLRAQDDKTMERMNTYR